MTESGYAAVQELTPRSLHLEPRHETLNVRHPAWRNSLRQTIITRVIPRMAEDPLFLHEPIKLKPIDEISAEQVLRFADLVLTGAVPSLVTHIEDLQSTGISMNNLLIQLVGPTARHFGDLWTQDRMSFLEVTAGVCRLQSVIRIVGTGFEADGLRLRPDRRILLAPAFGEQHILGLTMVASFFRRAGWEVVFEPRLGIDDMLALVRVERFATIGFSVATDSGLNAVRSQVERIRNASLANNVALIAGGPVFLNSTVDAEGIGIDGIAVDATEAVRLAEAATLVTRIRV